jgi:nucleotidyltransferase substrate binding protein (TIGR01987 family)
MTRKLDDSLTNLSKALANLERALLIPRDRELVVEGTIQRFEVTIELFWKTLKRALEYEGFAPKTPRESVRQAFQIGWIHDEDLWLDMLDSRNTTSHVYLAEEMADDNYDDIARVTPTLRSAFDFLHTRYPADNNSDEGEV